VNNPYETLEINKNASPEEIKEAYRNKAMNSHPDHGGSHEDICGVTEAYGILSDPVKRKRYDETGQSNNLPEEERVKEKASGLLINSFMRTVQENISSPDLLHTDIIKLITENLENKLLEINNKIKSLGDKKVILEEVKKRLEHRGGDPDFLVSAMEGELMGINKAVDQLDFETKVRKRAIEMYEAYTFKKKRGKTRDVFSPTIGSWNTYSTST